MKKFKMFFSSLWLKFKSHKRLAVFSALIALFVLVFFSAFSCFSKNKYSASARTSTTESNNDSVLITTSAPPILFFGDSSYSLCCPLSFYITSSSFIWSTGDSVTFNVISATQANFAQTYGTTFTSCYIRNSQVLLSPDNVFAPKGFVQIADDIFKNWDSFYKHCVKGSYSITCHFFNDVVPGSSAPGSSEMKNPNNCAVYTLTFATSNSSLPRGSIAFTLSSMNPVPSTASALHSSNYDLGSGYTLIQYFQTSWSRVGFNPGDSYNKGYIDGYDSGYSKGVSESIDSISPWTVLVNGVDTFFNTKIFGSISIGTIFKIAVSTLLIGFIMKIFLGG